MKQISIYTCIFFLLSLSACTQKNKHTIEIQQIPIDIQKGSILKLSAFCDSIEIIPLQTTSENFIGEINRIIYSSGKYYIHVTQGFSNGQIHIYDSCGNFASKIFRLGNGPGEYMDLEDFYLTPEKNIKIASFFKIINYDSIGNFLNEKRINQPAKKMYPLSDGKYLLYNRDLSLHEYKLLTLLDENDNIINSFFKIPSRDANKSDLNNDKNAFSKCNDTIYFNTPYCDTIYNIIKTQGSPKYFIDYGNKKLPLDVFEETDAAKEMAQKLKRIPSFGRSFAFGIDKNFIYIGSVDKDYAGYFSLYFRHSNKILTGQKIEDDLYLKGNVIPLKERYLPSTIDQGNILCSLEPRYLIKGYKNYWSHLSEPERAAFQAKYPKLVKICSSLKEDDNPVLLRMHIKNQ